MHRQAILDLPLASVLREEIALSLQLMNIFTIGQFLSSWHLGSLRDDMTAMFDSPLQARNAVAVCANWLGGRHAPIVHPGWHEPWWRDDRIAAA